MTALTLAVRHFVADRRQSAVTLLLAAGADPNAGAPTPLAQAIAACDFDTALLLLQHGATTPAGTTTLWRNVGLSPGNRAFRMLCLLRAFGGKVSLDNYARSMILRGTVGLAWSEANADRIIRKVLPQLLNKLS